MLLTVTLLVALLLIDGGLLEDMLAHPVGWGEYLGLAWFASSIGTVAGALGSGLEGDEAVREAAYGYRHRARQEQSA